MSIRAGSTLPREEEERSFPVQDPKAPPSPDSSLENADVEIVRQKKGEERVVNPGTETEVIQESSGAADELPQPAASRSSGTHHCHPTNSNNLQPALVCKHYHKTWMNQLIVMTPVTLMKLKW